MVTHPLQADNIACRLLKFEQQLKAYEKLHAGELTELWQSLNECKQTIASIIALEESDSSAEPDSDEKNDHPVE